MADRCGFCGSADGPFTRVEGLFTVLMCMVCLARRARGRGPYPDLTEAELRAGLELLPTWALQQKAAANRKRRLEGSRRFSGSPPPNSVPPVHEYAHRDGRCAVIGGHVYRGSQIRGLQGAYVYGDVCDGRIRALSYPRGKPVRHRDLGLRLPGLVSFAEDRDGELYALSLADGIYRLTSAN